MKHLHYTALLWDPNHAETTQVALWLASAFHVAKTCWTRRDLRDGAILFDEHCDLHMAAHPLHAGNGVIYGHVFSRDGTQALTHAYFAGSAEFAAACLSTDGSYLVSQYWGNYLAVLAGPAGRNCTVIRGCGATIPCYYTVIHGVTLAFSDIRDVAALLPPLKVNWKYITAFLAWPHLEVRETGLNSVFELLAGEAITVSGQAIVTRLAWNPIHLCVPAASPDRAEAARQLRDTTQYCVEAWASVHPRILHSLSGGFDSAVVLSALMRSARPPDVLCFNRFGRGPAEDERGYARSAAQACGVQLLEAPWDVTGQSLDESFLASPRMPKPLIALIGTLLDARFMNATCTAHSRPTVWTGQGGDHIFLAAQKELGVADCFRDSGIGRELLRATQEAAILTRHSYWHVILLAIAAGVSEQRAAAAAGYTPNASLLKQRPSTSEITCYIQHPWWRESGGLPPGKRHQLMQLASVLNRERPIPEIGAWEEVHPLLSQPLVELALGTPYYVLLQDGKTRGLARQAFAEYIPPEIARRELKGQVATHALTVFRRSLPFVRDILLGGTLVDEGIVCPQALRELLEKDEPARPETLFPLFACVAAELWTRSWKEKPALSSTKAIDEAPFLPSTAGAATIGRGRGSRQAQPL